MPRVRSPLSPPPVRPVPAVREVRSPAERWTTAESRPLHGGCKAVSPIVMSLSSPFFVFRQPVYVGTAAELASSEPPAAAGLAAGSATQSAAAASRGASLLLPMGLLSRPRQE